MHCDEFHDCWPALIANSIDASTREAMGSHAAICAVCGPRWRGHEDADTTLQAIVEAEPLPKNVAEAVANDVYQNRFGAAVDLGPTDSVVESRPEVPPPGNRTTMVVLAMAAGLIGYLVGSGRGQSNPLQQLYNAQMLYGNRGQDLYQMMMMSEVLGLGGGGGRFLPNVTMMVETACLATILVWATRSKLWAYVYPSKIPAGLHAARWLGLIAALLGIGRCLGATYASMSLGAGGSVHMRDAEWMTSSLSLVNQLWGTAFWLTIVVLVITTTDRFVQSMFARRSPRR